MSTYQDATIFDEALHSMQSQPSSQSKSTIGPTFSYSLYVTNSRTRGGTLANTADTGGRGADKKNTPPPKKNDSRDRDKKATAGEAEQRLGPTWGRPDLQTEILSLSPWSSEAVVFACGPQGLLTACSGYCQKAKVQFKSEAFEL